MNLTCPGKGRQCQVGVPTVCQGLSRAPGAEGSDGKVRGQASDYLPTKLSVLGGMSVDKGQPRVLGDSVKRDMIFPMKSCLGELPLHCITQVTKKQGKGFLGRRNRLRQTTEKGNSLMI